MDLQAEYDNGAKVPSYPDYAERWTREAAAFRDSHPHSELAVAYGPTERQALDLFWPGAGRDGPVAVFIHGGYWQRMHRSAFSHLAQGLLGHGVAVAMPSYELCPNVTLATLVEQVRDLVPSGLSISGLFDLEPITHTTVNAALGLDVAEARRLSPLLLPPPGGRIHAYVGDAEGQEYTRQSSAIAQAWNGTWDSLPGLHHFSIVEELQNPASAMVAKALELIPVA